MQPTQPGWYWDPKGMPGLFRWWDGEGWTQHVSVIRNVGAPQPGPSGAPSADGRLHAGGLSCSVRPEPWTWCPDYPHIDDAIGQQVVVGHTARGDYIGCVFIGGVPDEYLGGGLDATGNAFSSAMLSTFYPAESPHDPPAPATGELDGHETWRLVVALDVRDDHLGFAREDAVFVLVDLPDRPGVLYASLPDVPDVSMPSADELIADLALG
ncbi:DUF2510 domain-containing protein [Aeromicrobium sp.]|uniref:DUF2510 domain-containing protein n=1 Tax=Aeromicrobium sp. TaxID=1871063 RepID=UPI003D6A9BB3